jgi:hypothetical protein
VLLGDLGWLEERLRCGQRSERRLLEIQWRNPECRVAGGTGGAVVGRAAFPGARRHHRSTQTPSAASAPDQRFSSEKCQTVPHGTQSEPLWLASVPYLCHCDTMDLTSYVSNLGREFATLAEAGGDEARALVERLTGSLESAIRMTLLDALSAAADEITRDLAPGSVELRLRGRDPNFVVTALPAEPIEDAAEDDPATADGGTLIAEDGPSSRINLRLPEQLKAAVEEAAAKEGRSVNAWLVRAASAALQRSDRDQRPEQRGSGKRTQQRLTGWVR